MDMAERHRLPAGGALAVDREAFSAAVTERLLSHPMVSVERREVPALPAAEIRTDEVVDRGVVLLAECPRCDHRWTERPPTWVAPASVLLAEETPAA